MNQLDFDEEKELAEILSRCERLSQSLKCFTRFFDPSQTSFVASVIDHCIPFIAIDAPGASNVRLRLFSFSDGFYKLNGRTRVTKELETIRGKMLTAARKVHKVNDKLVTRGIELEERKIKCLWQKQRRNGDINTKQEIKKEEKNLETLREFKGLPGSIQITQRFRDEVVNAIIARNIVHQSMLNKPSDGGLFRVAIRQNITLDGRVENGKLIVKIIDSDPAHLLTYAINASLLNENAIEEAKEWFKFSRKCMNSDGCRRFYEHAGYVLVTKYPLPTERAIHYMLGPPGTGKGTHQAILEELLRFDETVLFAKVSPHKFTDPREHFNRQTLQNIMLITHGDVPHMAITDASELNEIMGGQPIETERKFHDPVLVIPTFKVLYASTPPLHKVIQPGGYWRRVLLTVFNEIPESERNDTLKSRMLSQRDGFFCSCLLDCHT
ncbi:MAG: hypothetical protein QXJ62_06020 [Nitrososphaeria archaeon]